MTNPSQPGIPQGQQPGASPYGHPAPGHPAQAQSAQAPSAPGHPAPGQPPHGPYSGAFPAPPKNPAKKIIAIVVPVLVLFGIAVNVVLGNLSSDDTTKLEVGDCLQNKGSATEPDVHRVDCGAAEATHKVLGKKQNSMSPGMACQDVEGAADVLVWRESEDAVMSLVLCLGDPA
ncbi:hypothetical protein V1J52_17740 [Streptomyces sp. TRM 70351]|uniref:LppU/SCO3897 family protein n=1 Tax=Streptomyces sp. TRM 70351 TaxID=3116552 RepID=UPI002E7B07C9|nr:hypothetical protein [Streptomyces sp. TRM 70351]MEE1930005.1 hypothetical protein [Streptomyces sp. TRM 70351]